MAEGRTELIVPGGNKGFHLLDLRLAHTCQFPDLHDPVPQQLFRGGLVVHIRKRQGFRVILVPRQLPEDGTFPDALRAIQHKDTVELRTGIKYARYRGSQKFAGDGPDVRRIVRLQAAAEQRVDAAFPVPVRQILQILPDRMKAPVVRHLGETGVHIPPGEDGVAPVEVNNELRGVRIPPEGIRLLPVPGQFAGHLHAAGDAVVGEGLQKRVVVQDQHKIPGAVLEGLGVGVVFQVLDPGVIRGHSGPERRGQALCSGRTRNRRYSPRVPGSPRGPIPAEISGSGFRAFPVQAKLHRVLGKGEIAHLVEGLLGIVVPELMDPDQIKSIQQLPAGRVRRMMGIDEAVVVDHHAGSRLRGNVIPTVFGIRRRVDAGQEGFHGQLDGEILAAEYTDDAVLIERILLGIGGFFPHGRLPRRSRPLGYVAPVVIHCEIVIHGKRIAAGLLEIEDAVGGSGGPVHHAVSLIGGIVEEIHTELLRDHPHERLVLVLGNFPVKKKHQAVPRGLRLMLVRGIQEILYPGELLPAEGREIDLRRNVVRVQGAAIPGDHMPPLPDPLTQPAGNETAVILQIVPLGLWQLRILGDSLGGADRNTVPVLQLLPGQFDVFVTPVVAMVAHRNLQNGIIHRQYPPPVSVPDPSGSFPHNPEATGY